VGVHVSLAQSPSSFLTIVNISLHGGGGGAGLRDTPLGHCIITASADQWVSEFPTHGPKHQKSRFATFPPLYYYSSTTIWPQLHAVRAALRLPPPTQKPTKLIQSKKPASLQFTTKTIRLDRSDRLQPMRTLLKAQAAGGLSNARIWAL
jgi:hypothetical protein